MEAMTSTASTRTITVEPIAGNIGAEIGGVRLDEPLRDETVAELRAALAQWKVIFFRNQEGISQADHVAFGKRFGAVTPAHPTLPARFAEFPEILLLDNSISAGEGGPQIASLWHTDVTFLAQPPMGSILRGVEVPRYGGDTQFANTVVAYETLAPSVRDLVDGLKAVHHNQLPIRRGELSPELAQQFQSREIKAVHPVVRVHPETGERALFVNPNFTSHITEMSRLESRHLLSLLYEHMADAEYTCRFRWQPGDVAFWDNRATMHLVPTDVPSGQRRSMQRITLAGDTPAGPDGFESYSLT